MFGFGGSTGESSSSSSSQSSSYGQSDAGNIALGSSESGSQTQDSIAFEDIFTQMFGGASNTAMGLDPSMLTQQANQMFSGGMNFMQNLGGGAGSAYLEDRLSGDNAVLEEQIDLLGQDLGKFFEEELLTGITSEAVGGGQLGGGRQGVAQGEAANMVGREFRQGATALRAGDIAARDAAAGNLESLNIQGASAGIQGLPGLAEIANMGFGADMLPYMLLSQITGGPTVLNSGNSFSTASDFATGYSTSFDTSQATSESESSSSNHSINMGFGSG
jgi:hypothetical protein